MSSLPRHQSLSPVSPYDNVCDPANGGGSQIGQINIWVKPKWLVTVLQSHSGVTWKVRKNLTGWNFRWYTWPLTLYGEVV